MPVMFHPVEVDRVLEAEDIEVHLQIHLDREEGWFNSNYY